MQTVLGGVRIVELSISSHEQTQKNESDVFLYCILSLFLYDPFFPDYLLAETTSTRLFKH